MKLPGRRGKWVSDGWNKVKWRRGSGLLGALDAVQRAFRFVMVRFCYWHPIRRWSPVHGTTEWGWPKFLPLSSYIWLLWWRFTAKKVETPWPEKPERRFLVVPIEPRDHSGESISFTTRK